MSNRRELLRRTLGGLGALPLLRAPWRQDAAAGPWKLSLAQWSLHRTLRSGALDPLEFPRAARRDFGLGAVEYVSTFYAGRAADFRYLAELRGRCDDVGVQSLLIMVDGEGALGAPDDTERRRAVERHFKWIVASAYLGGHAIRVNAAGSGDRGEHSRRAAESLHRLCVLAEDYAVSVIVENHGGPSSNGAWLAETIRRADHPACGTLPDFGNFSEAPGQEYDRYRGLEELLPLAKALSAKSYDFDAAGEETTIDYRRALGLVHAAGYRGFIGIEYEGQRLSEADGIRATAELIRRLAAGFAE
jgi:L-ribulose-5-phosphate 3-epimerase